MEVMLYFVYWLYSVTNCNCTRNWCTGTLLTMSMRAHFGLMISLTLDSDFTYRGSC